MTCLSHTAPKCFSVITTKSAVTKPASFLSVLLGYNTFYFTNQSIASDNTINTGLLTLSLFLWHNLNLLNLPAVTL